MNCVSHLLVILPGVVQFVFRGSVLTARNRHFEAQSVLCRAKSGVQQPIPEIPTCIGMSKEGHNKCRTVCRETFQYKESNVSTYYRIISIRLD